MSSMSVIENLYYTCDVSISWSDEFFDIFRESYAAMKDRAMKEDVFIDVSGVHAEISPSGMRRYPYKLTIEDKADIYFAHKAVGSNYPIYVMLYAKYMWLHDLDTCTQFVNGFITDFLATFGIDVEIVSVKVNRTDFACHNTYIDDLIKWLPEEQLFKKVVFPSKNVTKYYSEKPGILDDEAENNGVVYGKGDLLVRIYDKTREIIEMRHKEFFIPLWYQHKLISKYDYEVYTHAVSLGSKSYEMSVIYGMYKYWENNILMHFDLINKYYAQEYKALSKFATVFDAMQYYFDMGITKDYIRCVKRIFRLYNKYVRHMIDNPRPVFNVEFQVRRPVLKQVAFVKESEEGMLQEVLCKLDSIESLKENAQTIYDYLVTECFRVIVPGSATRKTRCKIDPIWQKIQQTKMYGFVSRDNIKLVREYISKLDKLHTVKRTVSNVAHLAYINNLNDVGDLEYLTDMVRDDIMYYAERQLVDMDRAFKRQIRSYGSKGT